MRTDLKDRLQDMGFIKRPFVHLDPGHPDFFSVFINRDKEINKIIFSVESLSSANKRNIALTGRSRIGKSMLIQYTLTHILKGGMSLFFDYPPSFCELCRDGINMMDPGRSSSFSDIKLRDVGNVFLEVSRTTSGPYSIAIDNFEEMLQKPVQEIEEFIRIFRRSRCLFLIACMEDEWCSLVSQYPQLRYAFSEEIVVSPFSLDHCRDFFGAWMSVSRKDPRDDIYPFSEDAVRLIGIYSFFIPGCMNDLANRVFSEALSDNTSLIDADYIRGLLVHSPMSAGLLSGLAENEFSTIEYMIEYSDPITFEILAEQLGVSRVAAGGYIQTLIDRGIAVKLDAPGKKKMFQVSEQFKAQLV